MRIRRVHSDPLPDAAPGESFAPAPAVARYIFDVLRARPGDRFTLFSRAGEISAEAASGRALVALERRDGPGACASPPLTLFLPLMKGERLRDALRMAVEVGVDRVVPVAYARSVRELARPDSLRETLERIAGQAAQQCGAPPPPISPPLHGAAACAAAAKSFDLKLFFDPESPATLAILPVAAPPATIAVATGPEGGFTAAERATLRDAGFLAVALRAHVLRCETAVPVCLALVRERFQI